MSKNKNKNKNKNNVPPMNKRDARLHNLYSRCRVEMIDGLSPDKAQQVQCYVAYYDDRILRGIPSIPSPCFITKDSNVPEAFEKEETAWDMLDYMAGC